MAEQGEGCLLKKCSRQRNYGVRDVGVQGIDINGIGRKRGEEGLDNIKEIMGILDM